MKYRVAVHKLKAMQGRVHLSALQPIGSDSGSQDVISKVAEQAKQGVDINRGSSSQLGLSDKGRTEAKELGQGLAKKGGVDSIIASDAARTKETANAIVQHSQKPVNTETTPHLESWRQGNLEGQPQKLVEDHIFDLMKNKPDEVLPGIGPAADKKGESFNQFKKRALTTVKGVMDQADQNPDARLAVVTHSQAIKALKGWLSKGAPDDLSVSTAKVSETVGDPASVERLYRGDGGKWQMEDVDTKSSEPLKPGVYVIRHGATPWNKENYENKKA